MAAMGRRTALWKAALWGGIAGTLPDLDVVIDHGDALRNMIMHRGASHSLFWLTLAARRCWRPSRPHSTASGRCSRAGGWRCGSPWRPTRCSTG